MTILDSAFAQAHRMLREERLADAETVCRSLLRLAPNHPELTHLMAAIGCRTGTGLHETVAMARRAVGVEVQRSLFLNTLAVALRLAGRRVEAARWLERTLQLDPLAVEPRLNLGGVLADQRDPRARREMRRALALAPASGEGHNNLGAVDVRVGVLAPAILRFGRALALAPRLVDAWRNLSGASSWSGLIGAALAAARKALSLAPSGAEAQDMLANALVALGDAQAAQVPLRRATAIRPDFREAGSNLLFALAYDGGVTTAMLGAAQRAWGRGLDASVPSFANDRSPERKLRLGYLSGDLRVHPVGWNVEGLIRSHDRSRFEVFLYSTTTLADDMTRRFAAMADGFRDLATAGPNAVRRAIREDRIDVLVALAPHTADNPAAALAEKPAPVVVAFHAIGSTGLATVDHWVTDDILHPEGTAEKFTESLLRLPCFYLHAAPEGSPEPDPPPSVAAGHVTFGSFNNPAKVTPDVVALWARVLAAVPGSRLLLRSGRRFGDPLVIGRFRGLFARHGIAAERLVFGADLLPRAGHLAAFNKVDVSLDPFPFNGSTTTFESLWMGVPVVTLIGDRFVGRVGLDVLSRIGLTDLAAADHDGYVATAATLAADVSRRAGLRTGLRGRLLVSPLCDATGYTRAFEAAIREAWRRRSTSP
ncbi:MAG: glycosyltransferase family 41 protein [Alphaproteobacteria bacterium]|nr:glycosyltransferase family 41 protein [Alphaproteobacteria bacterium]